MKTALLAIDFQNDYFADGTFPLWNAEGILAKTLEVLERASRKNIPVIFIQHIANGPVGSAPFFNKGSLGAEIHPQIHAAALMATVVTKEFADGFHKTDLEDRLSQLGVTQLLICGMMTQNCVTHTAISKAAEKYGVSVIGDCCTTVSEILHNIALRALSTRISLQSSQSVFTL